MDLKQLQYFIAVYEQGSFSHAAKVCYIAQPSISAAISQLESQFNQVLFNRHARGVSATPAGQQLYPLAKQLIGQAKAIQTSLMGDQEKQQFSLGVTKGLGVKRMSTLLKQFISEQPQMELTLVPQYEQCNARIIIKEELASNESYHVIWQEQYLLALPLEHPLSLKDHITLDDLDGVDFIQRTPCSAWQLLQDTLTLSGIQLAIRAKIQTIDYALGLVKAGLGGALVPAHKEIIDQSDICFKPLQQLALHREIVLAYSNTSPLVETLLDCINNMPAYKD
ncbi:LysR family transcriptional regulator [Thalassotalea marina]|uniref:LysR family transcriptional regulator n=1 Tax=Thalassotalea marina TaxID=1673741 RepID=A0A919BC18_9GAMM|nr:LysR family transcriptional regulator [Thalassotalea marina]GHF79245.1 LysR family transcriptional regulator [Thalassotalea marina]